MVLAQFELVCPERPPPGTEDHRMLSNASRPFPLELCSFLASKLHEMPGWISSLWYAGHLLATGQLDNTLPGPRKHNISLTGLTAFALLQVGAFLPWAAVCLLPVAIIVHSSASVRLIIKRANLLIERQGPLVLEFYMPRWHPPVGDCMHHSRDTV